MVRDVAVAVALAAWVLLCGAALAGGEAVGYLIGWAARRG